MHFKTLEECVSICICIHISSVTQSCLFATPWIAALQASLSITNSRSLLKLMCIESVMPSNHPILCRGKYIGVVKIELLF